MTETTSSTASLRRLVPRLFSRAQPAGAVEQLIRTARLHHPKADMSLIERAYAVAERAHDGQKRKSGEPYITHPVAVAQILADLGIGPKTLAAALLHDTVEDTEYTLDMLRHDFGDEIAMLVDGVTKLDKLKYGDSAQAETVRKMVVAMSKDIRVLVIKLADRLHNARTWGFVESASAERKAKETLEIYAPLAHRLGISTIKWELEDLSFAVLYPKIYVEIENLVKQRTPQREQFVQQVIDSVNDDLRAARIRGKVAGRPKQYYSIYQKMVVRGREFDEIYDLVGIRVLVDSLRDCYAVLGAIHARWTPVPGRFKDYIATPKFNLYQSLHTTVIGPKGRPVEIQIRTHEMHQRAEFGVAAHWKYKERMNGGRATEVSPQGDTDLAWLAHISDWQSETADPGEFLDSLRFEIGAKEVYVFTPHGKVIGLPAGGTPVDFAYAVPDVRVHRLRGAHGRRAPHDGREGQRAPRAAREPAHHRRRRRGVHVEEPRQRSQQGLAGVRQERPRAQQDQAVVHQGAPRGGDRAGQGRDRPRHAQAEPPAAEAHEPGRVLGRGAEHEVRRRRRALRGRRRGARLHAVRDREGALVHPGRQRRGGRGGLRRHAAIARLPEQRLGRAGARGPRHPREARQVLHARPR
jgi:guanosine-3',5'-bis(diphosphate) 3'-pyrophosphohydrolase